MAIFAACLIPGTLGRLLHFLPYPFVLLTNFQPHHALAALLATGALLVFRARSLLLLGLAPLALALHAIVPWYFDPRDVGDSPRNATLRVLILNLHHGNKQHAKVIELCDRTGADLILLQEYTSHWRAGLSTLSKTYPHHVERTREDAFGIALFSRFELRDSELVYPGRGRLTTIRCRVVLPAIDVNLIATHPFPPAGRAGFERRNEQLAEVTEIVRSIRGPLILAGDLNATMWSPAYQRLIDHTGLRNAREGFGILPTWPAPLFSFLRIPLDHCLVTPEIAVISCESGPDIGSDHLPLLVNLTL